MKSIAASASGVLDAARPGSVPSATICTSVNRIVTMMIVMISANGTARLGSRASPAGTGTTSYPPNAKIRSSPVADSCGERWRLVRDEQRRVDEEDPDDHEGDEREQLPHRQHVQYQAALLDPLDVDGGNRDDDRRDEGGARPAGPERRHVEPERRGQDVDDRRPARRAREPQHPADFERGKAAERRASVQVGAACAIEPAAHLGKRQRDEHRGQADRRDEPGAPAADARGIERRLRKDRAADHLVDADRRQIPAAQLAAK